MIAAPEGPVSNLSDTSGMVSSTLPHKSRESVLKSVLNANNNMVHASDIIQFSSAEYYCTEGEGFVEVEVDRLGRGKGMATVEYSTYDGSAKAGVKYEASQGTLTFDANASEQRIRIPILEDESFDTSLDFEICLKNPKNAI
mmetsp:Transcript_78210/g.147650  ORF Transcript_78210/g.147650 Transcript_78210/m.147650 type:complete len:142 (+) Transcript_78210:89-514(+)